MFTEQKPFFIYAVSPLHMGTGTTIGVVDNPIQREVHTGWPSMAGSGIKGAIRHALKGRDGWTNGLIEAIFGPEAGTTTDLYAGAISFTDAQIVCFPVRSLRRSFVYATCPTALARLGRLVGKLWSLGQLEDQNAWVADKRLLQDGHLILEALAYNATEQPEAKEIAAWLAAHALAAGFFQEKLKNDLVILSDTDFTHFVKNSTLIEPHVRIEDTTGTASDGGLFYTENLPPESLLVTLAMASQARDGKTALDAQKVIEKVSGALGNGKIWQFGGDATTGRGLVMLRPFVNGGAQ
ncbi:MAG TPA: type III-B CRISPR module RAMP protein Cmr4 [Terriglobia bacterium]|nr:type III-B CRISPR module RAMP protein Cmr4 [Terriglobia bacterium]